MWQVRGRDASQWASQCRCAEECQTKKDISISWKSYTVNVSLLGEEVRLLHISNIY
jgi:hypothetical protein